MASNAQRESLQPHEIWTSPADASSLEQQAVLEFVKEAAVAIHWVGPDGTILWANPAELNLLGYAPEEYIGHNIREFHVDAGVIEDVLGRLKSGEELRDYEARLRAKDGSIREVAITSNVHWADKRFIHTRCFTRDITEQKRVSELQARLAAIVESSDDAIISKDLNGIIRSWNRGAERIFGYTAEEAIGRPVAMLAPPDHLNEMPTILDRIRRGDRVDHYETKRRTKDGRILTISLTVSPIRDGSGTIIGASKIARDVTAQKEAEQANQQLQRELMLLIEASGALLASPHAEDVLQRIMEAASQLIQADAYAVWRRQAAGPMWKLVASEGLSPAYERSTSESRVGEGVRIPPEPFAVEDVEQHPLVRFRSESYRAEGIRSMLTVPLRIQGEIAGTIVFYYRSHRQFGHAEIRLAGALGNLAAAALGTAELYDRELDLRAQAERAERRASFLAEAGVVLSSSLDYQTTLRRVAQTAVPAFADWCSVELVESRGKVRRVAIAHQDPARVEVAREFERKYPPRATDPVHTAIRTRKSILIEDVTEGMLVNRARSPEHLEDVRALGIRSLIVVPMLSRERAFGTLTFVSAESGRRYSAADLAFAEELAGRAATAIDNARLHAEVRENEERLRLAQAAAGIGNWEWNLTTGAVKWSPELYHMIGAEPGSVVPSLATWMAHVYPDDRGRLEAETRDAIRSGTSFETEFRVLRPGGEVRWVLSHAKALQNESGKPVRVLGLNMDVTARKTTEERTAFLLQLEDEIRPLADPGEITQMAARLLGKHLAASRCAYADVERDGNTLNVVGGYTNGVESIAGRHTIDEFGSELGRACRAGRNFVASDSEADPRTASAIEAYRAMGIRGLIATPLMKAGRIVAVMAVHQINPRQWREDEVELVRQVANRCWESIERARVGRELRESEARFRVMADSAPVLIWLADTARQCVWLNRPWLEFTGRKLEEELRYGWSEGIHPDDVERALRTYDEACARYEPFQMEFRLRRRDGQYRWILDHGVPLFGPEGAFSGYIGSCIDITDRIDSEAALRRSEARFRQLADAVPAFVWVADPDGQVQYFNDRWYQYTGLMAEESLGDGWCRTLHPGDRDRVVRSWSDAIHAEVPYSVECRFQSKDGSYRWYMARALPVCDTNGNVVQWFGTNTDIEEAKRTEGELRKANAELEEFAYVSSHDLQEPLRMIHIYTQLLLKKPATEPDAQRYGDFIRQGVRRMEQLIQDLLAYSRTIHTVEQGAGATDLAVSLQDALEMLQTTLEETGARIRADRMPLVRADRSQLALVFQNLVANSLKYRKAGVSPQIEVSANINDGQAIVSVRDNGIGFDKKYAEQIFGLFKRLHKDEYPGTGLGLAICRRIIERYGGRIWAESRAGEGATFFFVLPVASEAT